MSGIPTDEEVRTPADFVKWLLAAEDCLCVRMRNLEDVINQPPARRVRYILGRCIHMLPVTRQLVRKLFANELVKVKLNAMELFRYIAALRGWMPRPPYPHTIRPPQVWAC